jgi:hypothetical protein
MKIFTRRIMAAAGSLAVCPKRKIPHFITSLLLLCTLSAFSQEKINVKGVVKDAEGGAMPGVTVLEKGTRNATNTDGDGAFSLNVAGESSVLVFTSIGSTSREVTVGTQRTLSVSMQQQNRDINEVVVIGYGQTKKASVTGSVASVFLP